MKLTFDYYHNLEQVDLYLCNPDGRELFPLPGKSRNLTLRFNDLSELTFEVDSKITLSDNTVVDLEAYDYIQTKRLVFATNIGWFQISGVDEHDNGVVKYKSVTTESYQSVLKNKGFISEERVYCFYNPNDPHDDRYDSTKEDSIPSVLGQWSKQLGIKQALEQGTSEPTTPYEDWTVTYIHSSLYYTGVGSKCRTFKENVTYGYDWMVNDVEEAFEVVVLFDFMYKTIHVMAPNEVAQRVNVIYTFNNFMKSVDINETSEDIVTVLNCNGNNCDITAVNPTGTNYICDFSYYMDEVNNRWMSPALIAKLKDWKAACDEDKDTYEEYIEEIRTAYQLATEKETLLREMSLSLADLRTAQNKRMVLGSGTPGGLCGIVTAESVKTYRKTVNGVTTVVGGRSIKSGTEYFSTDFTGSTQITAYQFSPKYDPDTKKWDWSEAGSSKNGTADEIVASNLSDSNTLGVSYWYFSDVSDNSSYCKLQSAVTVNKDDTTSTYYCGGFDRYIAYTYPVFETTEDDTTTGVTSYTDDVQSWIDLRETHVKALNTELYGYALTTSGYNADYEKTVDVNDAKEPTIYVTTGSGGKLLPQSYTDAEGVTRDSIYKQVNDLNALIGTITSELNILSYFADTPALLRELNCYWIEGDYTNDNIAVLDNTKPEEEIDLSNELLAAGYIELSKVCQPRFSFSIESVDATKQYEFRDQMCLLELGKIITIEKEEGIWYYPALLEISMSLDNSDEFSMTFANAMRLDDWGYTYADLISDASSTSRKVSANWQDILAYAKERETITSMIKDPLDTTLRAASANMVNQEFIIDKNGMLGKKRVSETSDEYEKEQVRLINNLLIFTDDNWETAKTALGKIYYKEQQPDGSKVTVTSYGLIAETIIGSLIMGEQLKIKTANQDFIIDKDGILGRKRASGGSDNFELEQVRLINNQLIFTDDNWETSKTALGKISYTDDNKKQVTSYGLNAETIIGSLIMGEQLKIKNSQNSVSIDSDGIIIKNNDGTEVFKALTDGGVKITNDENRVSIDSDGIIIKNNDGTEVFKALTDGGVEITGKFTTSSAAGLTTTLSDGKLRVKQGEDLIFTVGALQSTGDVILAADFNDDEDKRRSINFGFLLGENGASIVTYQNTSQNIRRYTDDKTGEVWYGIEPDKIAHTFYGGVQIAGSLFIYDDATKDYVNVKACIDAIEVGTSVHTHSVDVTGNNAASSVTGTVTVPTVSRTQKYLTATNALPNVSKTTDSVLGANTKFTVTGGTASTTNIKATASGTAVGASGIVSAITGFGKHNTSKALGTGATFKVSGGAATTSKMVTTTVKNPSVNSVSIPNVTANETVTASKVATSGSKTNGTAASWGASVTNGVLSFTWTANTPTSVTLPTFSDVTATNTTLGTALSASKVTTSDVTVATGGLASTGSGASVATGVGAITVAVDDADSVDAITALGATNMSTVLTGVKVIAQPTIALATGAAAGAGVVNVATGISDISVTASGDNVTALTGVEVGASKITLTNNSSNVAGSVPVVSAVSIGSTSANLANGVAAAQKWTQSDGSTGNPQ